MTSIARLVCVIGLSFGTVAGCGGDDGDSGPIKIGLLAPKSGALESIGASFERVATVAVDSINNKGGILGRQLELIVEDTETVADNAPLRLQDLIDKGVIAVVGPATSGEVEMSVDVARQHRVPIISPSSTAPSLSRPAPLGPDDDGYMFRNVPDDEIQGIAMAKYLKDFRQPAISSVAVVYEATPYGTGLKDAFKTAFENLGGSVTLQVDFPQNLASSATATADTTIAELVNASPQPSMVVLIALEQDALKLVQEWDSGGSPQIPNMQFFMTDGARTSGFLMAAPTSVRGMCGTAPTFPVDSLAYGTLQSAYEAQYSDALADQVFAPNVWDGFHLLAAAMVMQTQKYPKEELGGPHLRDAITAVSRDGQIFHAGQWRDLISSLRAGNDIDYDGAAGPNDFDVVGQAVGPYEVWCIASTGTAFTQELFLQAKDIQALRP